MNANFSSTAKTHLIRGVFYLLILLAVCVIPFALAQRSTERQNTVERRTQLPITFGDSDRDAGALLTPEVPTGGPVWDQYNNPAMEPPLGIGSQKFEPAMAAFDDQAADDFGVNVPPPPIFLYVTGVRVMGEYSTGGGPASSFNVYIYDNAPGHLPGNLIASFLNRPYTGTPPDFTIQWTPIRIFPSSGTYWVSVQAVQDFNPNGQWFWHNQTVQSNAGAVWQNPGDGYGTGCITWNRKNACMPDQVGPDQVFQILGFYEGPTPTATVTPLSSPSPTPTATPTPTPILCVLFQDFDGVTPPALPPGWTAANAINPDGVLWQTSNSGSPTPPADTPPNAAWVNDPATLSDKRLTSPPVTIPVLQNSIVTFRHNYAFENGFDGALLEISIDNGPFQDAASFILQGGYNGTISTCCGNPLAGRQAWTGSSGGFITTSVTLPSGHTIALRWRMGSDNGGSGQGWRIDTLQTVCEGPTPTSTPTVTASATPTATATVTVTPTATVPPSPSPTPSEPSVTPSPTPTAPPFCDPIQNGGFETGSFPPWVIQDTNPMPTIRTDIVHSGTYAAHIGSLPGGETPGDSSFYQTVRVPTGGAFLTFWVWKRTTDTIANDWQDAYITDSNGNILQTIFHQCTNAEWLFWQRNIEQYAGQTIRIKFLVHGSNGGNPTDMFVDDVQVIAPCPSVTPTSTPTATPTVTATATATATATPTSTITVTASPSSTATARPSPTQRPAATPRPRPTPPPRS